MLNAFEDAATGHGGFMAVVQTAAGTNPSPLVECPTARRRRGHRFLTQLFLITKMHLEKMKLFTGNRWY